MSEIHMFVLLVAAVALVVVGACKPQRSSRRDDLFAKASLGLASVIAVFVTVVSLQGG